MVTIHNSISRYRTASFSAPIMYMIFDIIAWSWDVRGLIRELRAYSGFARLLLSHHFKDSSTYFKWVDAFLHIKYCPQCPLNQTRRHKPWGNLQPIDSPPVPFHTITIDFIPAVSTTAEDLDGILTVTDEFSKQPGALSQRHTMNDDW